MPEVLMLCLAHLPHLASTTLIGKFMQCIAYMSPRRVGAKGELGEAYMVGCCSVHSCSVCRS